MSEPLVPTRLFLNYFKIYLCHFSFHFILLSGHCMLFNKMISISGFFKNWKIFLLIINNPFSLLCDNEEITYIQRCQFMANWNSLLDQLSEVCNHQYYRCNVSFSDNKSCLCIHFCLFCYRNFYGIILKVLLLYLFESFAVTNARNVCYSFTSKHWINMLYLYL